MHWNSTTSMLYTNALKQYSTQAPSAMAYNNALNYRSLRSLDSQKLRSFLPVSLIVIRT